MSECIDKGCSHERFREYDTCACHMPMEQVDRLTKADLMEAIRLAALENEEFEVSGDGDIRLREEDR